MLEWWQIAAGVLIGSGAGLWMARSVEMTAMPQMVSLLSGFGGGASMLVGAAEYLQRSGNATYIGVDASIAILLSVVVGAMTLTGSLSAWAKLQELMTGRPVVFQLQRGINALLLLVALACATWLVVATTHPPALFPVLAGVALLLGILLVLPIGGADMPVVISLLNAYSGIAVAATGFVIGNSVLISTGALVGASGMVLTRIMCKAMN